MNTKNKIIFSSILFIFLDILLIVFLIYPLLKDVKIYSQEIVLKKGEIKTLENKIIKIEEFKKNYNEIKKNLDRIEGLFVNFEAPIDFISFLEKNSKDLSIKISLSRAEKNDKPWPSLSFLINVSGSFQNFLKFFEKIELSPYLVEIKNLNIKKLSPGSSGEEIEANFLIKIFAK